ncbi:MAG TPA: methyl-accepting chemotaxis protein, partial [Accumulibacter sp.]|nr:methyl-accepting chemotaxis protein [Accumulibacter sp.]
MRTFFRNLSLKLKLNLVQSLVVLTIVALATALTLNTLRNHLIEKSIQDMARANHLVVSLFAAFDRSLRNDVERIGKLFMQSNGQDMRLSDIGGKPVLLQAGERFDDRLDLVDAFAAKTGTFAAILVRNGDDFLLGATTLKLQDGSRPMGTPLGEKNPARKPLLAGNTFTGKATVFGKDYMTHYAPLRDADNKVIGALVVAVEITEALKTLKKNLLNYKVGETGYVFAIDAGENPGLAVIHPKREGKNDITVKDSKGFEFIREMVEKKNGTFRYDWANPGETRSRQKAVVFEHYPEWNWVFATGTYIDELEETVQLVARSLLIMTLVTIVAVLGGGFLVTRTWVAQPLQKLVCEADRIAAGDLQSTIEESGADEIGRLRRAIAQMAGNLKDTLDEVRRTADSVFEHATALVRSSESVTQGSDTQRESVANMAASVEELSVSIDQVVQHARDANQLTERSGKSAGEGALVVRRAVTAMNRITDFVHQSSSTVTDLGQRSQDISAVVRVIREIADQTNLLALNAAIEAARAGEQGRGFAVVADEVRKLAERTAGSTQTIAEMISNIQEGADAAIRQMSEGVATVEKGSALANQAGQSIGAIERSTREVAGAVAG